MVSSTIEPLIVDLLEWLAKTERSYEEALDAWRTSCPRLTVWEDANDRGFIAIEEVNGRIIVRPSALGLAFVQQVVRHP
jgi:hypothetical protein